jgi:polyhydroxybutyrate depolymerase
MVSGIEHAMPVDRQRVYATGLRPGIQSADRAGRRNEGIMAYTLACRTDIFAAIGPDSATELGTCPHPAPLSVIHVHGTADTRVPYDGGQGDGTAKIDGPAVPALNATWRRIGTAAHPGPPRAAW